MASSLLLSFSYPQLPFLHPSFYLQLPSSPVLTALKSNFKWEIPFCWTVNPVFFKPLVWGWKTMFGFFCSLQVPTISSPSPPPFPYHPIYIIIPLSLLVLALLTQQFPFAFVCNLRGRLLSEYSEIPAKFCSVDLHKTFRDRTFQYYCASQCGWGKLTTTKKHWNYFLLRAPASSCSEDYIFCMGEWTVSAIHWNKTVLCTVCPIWS